MNNLLYYLFEVNCSLMLGAALYFLVIKRLSFFQWNRYYLIGICLLSFLLPFGKVRIGEIFFSSITTSPVMAQTEQILNSVKVDRHLMMEEEMSDSLWNSFSTGYYVAYFYLFVALLLLFRFTVRYMTLSRKIRRLDRYEHNGFVVVAPFDHYANCSIRDVIVMDEALLNTSEGQLIFEHESQHILFRHCQDKWLIEVFRCLFWLNPLIYWLRMQLYLTHEYQVDRVLAKKYGKGRYARFLLAFSQEEKPSGLQSSLFNNQHELVERIQVMMARPSSARSKWKYTLTIPVLCLSLLFYSFINPPRRSWYSVFNAVKEGGMETIVLDPGHGGKDAGAKAFSGLTEKSLTWETCLLLKQELERKGYKVVLSRAGDEFKTLKERSNLEGDLFLSIHFDRIETKEMLPIRILYQSGVTNNVLEQHNHRFASSLDQKLQQNGLQVIRPQISTKHAVLRNAKIPALLLDLDNINAIDKNVKLDFVQKLANAIDQSFDH
ncbi:MULTISPECIES: N-acetylmuramoyl-L-alanine amidase [unclassified Sphingobacterium]|uniref:N-acetylmuramoyl-L-alanine amidase n=1 Tax=unclassified Sphingobacterium TaxID=2609468 RepID=UPI0025D86465|nr:MULTISPECIES: N-acetylmuramoyl-L-alanine amidase [unclassified Sphingobacterium]